MLAVNAVKEGYDDACRHRNDAQVNGRGVIMLDADRGEVAVAWKDVVEGDLLKVGAVECVCVCACVCGRVIGASAGLVRRLCGCVVAYMCVCV